MVGTVTCANVLYFNYLPVCLSMTSANMGLESCIPDKVFLMMYHHDVGWAQFLSVLTELDVRHYHLRAS